MAAVIDLQNVSFIYPDEMDPDKLILRELSLTIEEGSFVAVLGHNGSGKSTLAKLLNAIHLPTEGDVRIGGMNTKDEALLFPIRSTIGTVFQNPDNQIVASIVEEDVAFAPENLGVPPLELRARVDAALRMVGMYDFRLHAPHLLSGGQKQRVAIAGVLSMEPRCLVLDEATAMLDPVGRREIMDTIHTLVRERGMTVLLITHHMDEAAEAERVIVMTRGRVSADGTPKEVFTQVEALRAAGLSVPDTVKLLSALREEGLPLPLDAISDEACAAALYESLRT